MGINATLFGQMGTFIVFVWFTMKFVWPPLQQAMQARQEKIAEGLASAEKGEKALVEAKQERDKALADARAEAQEVLAAANKQASQIVEEAQAKAQAEAERIRANASADNEREIAKARDALRKQVGDLAVLGAARIVKREIDASKHAEVLSDLAEQL